MYTHRVKTHLFVISLLIVAGLGLSSPAFAVQGPQIVQAPGAGDKPTPGPQPPLVAPRPRLSGGSQGHAAVPARGTAPQALHQAASAAVQAAGGKPLKPTPPAANLPAHGMVIHPPAVANAGAGGHATWDGSRYVYPPASTTAPPSPFHHALGIPAPSAKIGSMGQFPSGFYGSTQVDNYTGCSEFGANETSIAQSSVNPNFVVATANTYQNGDGSCGDSHSFAFYSHDGGQHWQQTILSGLASSTRGSGDTSVSFDPVRNVFIAAFLEIDRNNGNNNRVGAEVSSDGASWALDTTFENGNVDKPMITVDQNPGSPHYGRVAVSWTEFGSSTTTFFSDYTDNGGNSWNSASSSINFPNGACGNGTSPAFDANGDLMVAWWACDGGGFQLKEEFSPDGGANWPGNDLTITGVSDIGINSCSLNNGGSAFRCNSFPSLAGDPNASDAGGTAFFVVWANLDGGVTDSRFPGVTATLSELHGLSTLNPTPTSASWNNGGFSFAFMAFDNFGDKFFPWAAFAPNGRLNVGYSDREDDASAGNPNGRRFDEYMTEASSLSSLRSASYISFQADGNLVDPGSRSFIGDYAGITSLDSNFDTFPVWTSADPSNNNARTMDLCYASCYTFLHPYTPLVRGSASFTDLYQFNTDTAFGGAGNNYWNAVGIREGSDGTSVDDDMVLYGNRYFSTFLAGSGDSPPFNDYLLENDNSGHSPSGPYFPQVHSFSSLGGSYTVEWAAGQFIVSPALADSIGASSVVRIYDAFLAGNTLYYVGLRPASGNSANMSLTLHSASRGNTQGRSSAVVDSGNVSAGQAAFISYATGSDPTQYDGIVVVNNNGGAGAYTVYADSALPSGSIAINGGAAFTNNATVTLTLAATNPTSGDPVLDMRFAINGGAFGAWLPFTTSANVTLPSGDGVKTVAVQYRNGAGAISANASDSITLDTTPPHTTASLSGSASSCGYSGAVTVTLAPTDGLSGIASTVYQVDGGAVTTYTAPFSVAAPGTHTVTFHSTDLAGNVESTQSISFTILGPATITQSPTSGAVNVLVTVNGSNYQAGETVKVFWDSTASVPVATATVGGACTFASSFHVPPAVKGNHSIIAVGQSSGRSATSTFTVVPKLSIAPTSGHAGSHPVVSGTGYGANEIVKVYFNCATTTCTGTFLGQATTTATGSFSNLSVTIPTGSTLGAHKLGGKGTVSHGFALVVFTVN